MTELARYWTPEFTDSYIEALNKDATFQSAAKSMRESIALRCLDTPDKTDCYLVYAIDRGRISVAEWTEEPSPSSAVRNRAFSKRDALARTTAPYDFWMRLDKKEVGVIDVIMSPDYRLEGAKLKVLRYLRVFNRMGDLASELPKSY
ncbi:MAG: hypothetical protein AAGE52_41995 [Myxococcota bacterium]